MQKRIVVVNTDLGIALVPLGGKKYPGRFAIIDAWAAPLIQCFNWYPKKRGGNSGSIYPATYFDGQYLRMHRLLTDPGEGFVPDHINGNTLDNRLSNLRVCSPSENTQNRVKKSEASSRFKGVYRDKGREKWRARIMVDGVPVHIGMFSDERDAARAYDKLASRLHGEFARLNFSD